MLCSSWRNITGKCIKSYFKIAFLFLAKNEIEKQESESKNCENHIKKEDWHTLFGGLATCIFNEFDDTDE